MALRSTIFKAEVDIADMDRGYYESHSLVLAQHPSETEERVMLRLAAFCLVASPSMRFGPGLSSEDEPAIYDLDDAGDKNLWVEVGLPDPRTVKKALSKSARVMVFASGEARTQVWWQQKGREILSSGRVEAFMIPDAQLEALPRLLAKMMRLSASVQDGTLWLSGDTESLEVTMQRLQA